MRFLFVTPLVPHPQLSGSQIRMYHIIKELSADYRCDLICLQNNATENDLEHLSSICSRIHLIPLKKASFPRRFKSILLQRPFTHNKEAISHFNSIVRNTGYDFIIAGKSIGGSFCSSFAEESDTLTIMDEGGMHHLFYRRTFQQEKNMIRKIRAFLQWKKMYRYEKTLLETFTLTTAVSPDEQHILQQMAPGADIVLARNGVDCDYFSPQSPTAREHTRRIVFCGSFSYAPNVDAALYIAHKVMPLLEDDVTFTAVGSNPPDKLLAINNLPHCETTGFVEDIRPVLSSAAAFVNPMSGGGGTRLKVLTAMATGCPVISTRIGAEGIEVADGESILYAENEREFADTIRFCLSAREQIAPIRDTAVRVIREKYDWHSVLNGLKLIIKETLR